MRLVSIVIAALTLAACESPTTPLEKHDLTVAAQQLVSLAGEAEWLAQQLRVHGVTTNLAWVHQQALGDDAVKIARDLAKPVPPALRADHEAISLADARLQVQLGRIAPAADRPDELDALQRDFHALAQRARPLAAPRS